MHSPGISVSTLVLGFAAVIAFVLIVALAQGIGQAGGGGICEALFSIDCKAVGR
jgi:hypothetical protein